MLEILGGIGADHMNLNHMIAVADRFFGDNYHFCAFAAGRRQFEFATHILGRVGYVRVGLEDNLYSGKGVKSDSSAEQVERVTRAIQDPGKEIATPDDASGYARSQGEGRDQDRSVGGVSGLILWRSHLPLWRAVAFTRATVT